MPLPASPTLVIPCPVCSIGRPAGRAATARYYQAPSATGAAFLMTGANGSAAYESHATRKTIADGLYDAGKSVIVIQWQETGSTEGILRLMGGRGYREAYGLGWWTAFKIVLNAVALPSPKAAAGNSGGSLQFLYAMQDNSADSLLAGVVGSGGPPMYPPAGFTDCLGGTDTEYLLGWPSGTCTVPSWSPGQQSLHNQQALTGGRLNFSCPVRIINSVDNSADVNKGTAFVAAVNFAGGSATHATILGSNHSVDQTTEGAAAILAALLALLP